MYDRRPRRSEERPIERTQPINKVDLLARSRRSGRLRPVHVLSKQAGFGRCQQNWQTKRLTTRLGGNELREQKTTGRLCFPLEEIEETLTNSRAFTTQPTITG